VTCPLPRSVDRFTRPAFPAFDLFGPSFSGRANATVDDRSNVCSCRGVLTVTEASLKVNHRQRNMANVKRCGRRYALTPSVCNSFMERGGLFV